MKINKPLPDIIERLRNLQEVSGTLEKLKKGAHDQEVKVARGDHTNHNDHTNYTDHHPGDYTDRRP